MHLNNSELTFELVFISKTRNLMGRVDLCGLKFVQSRYDLIAARGL